MVDISPWLYFNNNDKCWGKKTKNTWVHSKTQLKFWQLYNEALSCKLKLRVVTSGWWFGQLIILPSALSWHQGRGLQFVHCWTWSTLSYNTDKSAIDIKVAIQQLSVRWRIQTGCYCTLFKDHVFRTHGLLFINQWWVIVFLSCIWGKAQRI